jgi:hypothetical protein
MKVLWIVLPLGSEQQNKPCRGFSHLHIKTEAIVKKEGPEMLALVEPGLASSSEENTDKNTSPPPPHLMVPVDLRKDLGGECYLLLLLDTC